MISITCTNCNANLTIDDAFAGGVCRCQYCGTIQTVPAKQRPAMQAAAPAPAVSKTLYQNQARARATGSQGAQLDDLASAVASSGLAGSGLSSGRHTAAPSVAAAAPVNRRPMLPIILVACGAIIVLLGILLAVVLFRGHGSTAPSTAGGSNGSPAVASGVSFCGIPMTAQSTIFVLDRGNSISNDFDTLKAACYKAIDQLGPGRKFQIILWDNDSGPAEFPSGHMADATAGVIANMHRYFQDAVATGSSRLSGSLQEAVSRSPQDIVVATGKADLDDDDAAVLRSMVGKNIRIDAIQIYQGSPSPSAVLQEVSRATGGQYRMISSAELSGMAQ